MRKFVPREFFWDSIALYIISVIMDGHFCAKVESRYTVTSALHEV